MTIQDASAQLYTLEDELGRLEAKVRALRASVRGETVENHVFRGWEGPVSLADLFGDRERLIVIHNMGAACRYCTMWADGLNGLLPYLEKSAAVAMLNHDPVATQQATSRRRGWRFRMADASGTDFFARTGFVDPSDGSLTPGTSTFVRGEDGTIRRHALAYFGPHDRFCPVYSFLDLLPEDAEDAFSP
ncbi:DUF899 family protein [Salinarimonas sp.]|uniref:DUF899 family protein n=1 Tax=Salinarimonas sp. TaxID=2766526 RepID=UPI0032D930B1